MIPNGFSKKIKADGFFKLKHVKRIGSTNDFLKSLASQAEEGLVLVADEQTSGKGRFDRKFFSPMGGLYFSVLLHPNSQEVKNKLTLIAAVATADAIKDVCGDDATIKWVNDIVINDKKCCGILAETTENLKGYAVVGIGINIGDKNIDESIKDIACGVTKKDKNTRWELLAKILDGIRELYCNFDKLKIVDLYKNRCSTLGKSVKVLENSGEEYLAKVVDLDEEGHLIVNTLDGDQRHLYSGEVKILF